MISKFSRPLCFSILLSALCFLYSGNNVWGAFVDATTRSNISYEYSSATEGGETHAGAGAFDANGDGLTDIIVARHQKHPLLYINQGDGTFDEESTSRGLSAIIDAATFGAGDFDNDGDQDLFIAPQLGRRFFLFINDGAGFFVEDAIARGAAVETPVVKHKGYSIGLVDFDLDGFLDIYVSEWGVASHEGNANHSVLLRNRGTENAGMFVNVTASAGLVQPIKGEDHTGFSSAWGDFDGDGWPDFALIADYGASRMYWNNGDGTFFDGTEDSGFGLDENGMGVAVADYDRDGLLDIYVTSIYDRLSNERSGILTGNKLYRNMGNRRFRETATEMRVARSSWAWGTSFFEYDNDGDSDLIVTNGTNLSVGADPATTPYAEAAEDPTTLFINRPGDIFQRETVSVGLMDTGLGKAIIVLDYDRDGDEDVLITNSHGSAILYESDASGNGNNWLRLKLEGTISNRDGIGCIVTVTHGGISQKSLYNPSNAFLGQREAYLHFGLGAASVANEVKLEWPSGAVQILTDVVAGQVLHVVEPNFQQSLPVVVSSPSSGDYTIGESLTLSVQATGVPAPVIVWEKDGVVLEGETSDTFYLKRLTPYDSGSYRAKLINQKGIVYTTAAKIEVDWDIAGHTVARLWNDFLLDAIRKDYPNPTVHSRNLYHVSAAIWDTYWACEPGAWARVESAFVEESAILPSTESEIEAFRDKAISYAAYQVLKERYRLSPGADASQFGFRWLMEKLGYDPDFNSVVGDSAEAMGNRIGSQVLALTLNDGSNEANQYEDTSAYEAVNNPLLLELSGTTMEDLNRWQPLAFEYQVLQNGIQVGKSVQSFLGVNWREVETFAISKVNGNELEIDPGGPPQFLGDDHQEFIDAVVEVIRYSSMLDPSDAEFIDISPGANLNNSLGNNDGVGRAFNPVTGQAYAENRVKRADYGRILAEFWADGPASETPPGHWNTLLNQISEHPDFELKFAGQGEELDRLEWEVRAYLALNGAMHDAAVAAWTLKRQYDYSRPISMIRFLGELGQSSDSQLPRYHASGLPLIDDLIELVTPESSAIGQRHAHLSGHVGEIAIRAWAGEPEDSHSGVGGVDWILAVDWLPYQRSTFVTPAFAAYVSGHSTFSRAAAEVVTLITGSPYFPGGMGEYRFPKNGFLEFESGPSEDVILQWATYYDAADEAGESRLYGGIHVPADDFVGRRLGAQVGLESFLKVQRMLNDLRPEKGLLNISSRARVGLGEHVMISGFVVDGDQDRDILLRSIGPGLEGKITSDFATDPRYSLYSMMDLSVVSDNDNWADGSRSQLVETVSEQRGAFPLVRNSSDAADIATLSPGVYTAVSSVEGAGDNVALAEVYGENLVNISARANVSNSVEGELITGFYLERAEPTTLLIRALGPTLEGLGVADYLQDPVLKIYRMLPNDVSELILENDDWQMSDTASLAEVAAKYVGAAPLLSDSKDAALLVQLPQGLYSVVVSSENGEGVALAEVYHVE